MKKPYRIALKTCFRACLLKERARLGLTQPQMARKLLLEDRSYAALESGESCCGTLTFVLFLFNCCDDPMLFLKDLQDAMDGVKPDAA